MSAACPSCSTDTARCRSGTSPPPHRTSASRWDRRRRARRRPRLQGRHLPLAPQVHRRSRHARPAGGPQRAVPQPGPGRARRRHGRLRQPDRAHRYLDDIEHREEGGTPAIVESIRAGLVFQLKEAVGTGDDPRPRGDASSDGPSRSWAPNPNIEILGNHDAERLSIVSFVVRHGDRYLHHNYVVALLNDLFGIQSRAAARAPGPTGIACSVSTSRPPTSSSGRSPAAARASSPAGSGSTSTTSSPRRSSSSSSQAVHLVAERRLAAAPLLPLRPATGLWHHRDKPAASRR